MSQRLLDMVRARPLLPLVHVLSAPTRRPRCRGPPVWIPRRCLPSVRSSWKHPLSGASSVALSPRDGVAGYQGIGPERSACSRWVSPPRFPLPPPDCGSEVCRLEGATRASVPGLRMPGQTSSVICWSSARWAHAFFNICPIASALPPLHHLHLTFSISCLRGYRITRIPERVKSNTGRRSGREWQRGGMSRWRNEKDVEDVGVTRGCPKRSGAVWLYVARRGRSVERGSRTVNDSRPDCVLCQSYTARPAFHLVWSGVGDGSTWTICKATASLFLYSLLLPTLSLIHI